MQFFRILVLLLLLHEQKIGKNEKRADYNQKHYKNVCTV